MAEHIHDASCSFGNSTCPEFGSPPPMRRHPRIRERHIVLAIAVLCFVWLAAVVVWTVTR